MRNIDKVDVWIGHTVLAEPVSAAASLCTYWVYDGAMCLLPLGKVQDWFLSEYKAVWEWLAKISEIRGRSRWADKSIYAALVGIPEDQVGDLIALGFPGKKGFMGVELIFVRKTDLGDDTLEYLRKMLFIAPSTDISFPVWMKWVVPQIISYHVLACTRAGKRLSQYIDGVGLDRDDYWRMGLA